MSVALVLQRLCVFLLAAACLPALAAPCAGFNDVDDASAFCANVEWIKNRGITLGCASNLYCPNDPVSRLAMAAFISRLDKMLPLMAVDSIGRPVGPFSRFESLVGGTTKSGNPHEMFLIDDLAPRFIPPFMIR